MFVLCLEKKKKRSLPSADDGILYSSRASLFNETFKVASIPPHVRIWFGQFGRFFVSSIWPIRKGLADRYYMAPIERFRNFSDK